MPLIELYNHFTVCKEMTCEIELLVLDSNTFSHLIVCELMINIK